MPFAVACDKGRSKHEDPVMRTNEIESITTAGAMRALVAFGRVTPLDDMSGQRLDRVESMAKVEADAELREAQGFPLGASPGVLSGEVEDSRGTRWADIGRGAMDRDEEKGRIYSQQHLPLWRQMSCCRLPPRACGADHVVHTRRAHFCARALRKCLVRPPDWQQERKEFTQSQRFLPGEETSRGSTAVRRASGQ